MVSSVPFVSRSWEPRIRGTLERFSVAADCLSVVRNSLSALSNTFLVVSERALNGAANIQSAAKANMAQGAANIAKVVGAGVLAGGVLGVVIGPALVGEAVRDLRKAWKRDDWKEGIAQTEKAGIGASYGVVGAGMIVGQSAVYASLPAAGAVAAAGTTMFTVGAFGMYSVLLLSAIRKIGMNIAFCKELNEQGNEDCQVAWLKNEVGSNESEAIKEAQNKWHAFVSIVGEDCAKFVKELPEELNSAQKTAHVIKEVRRASNKHFLMQGIRIGIAVLGFTAVILGILLTGPFAPIVVAILFAVGGLLWLVMDSSVVNKRVGDLAFGKGEFTLPGPKLTPFPPVLPSVKLEDKSYLDLINRCFSWWSFPQSSYIAQ